MVCRYVTYMRLASVTGPGKPIHPKPEAYVGACQTSFIEFFLAKIVNSLKSLIIDVCERLHRKSVSSFKIVYSHGRW